MTTETVVAIDWMALALVQAPRFWSKVNRAGRVVREDLGPCWEWTAGVDKDGYGKYAITAPPGVRPKQRHVRAHRLSLEMARGVPLDPKFVTIHACDNVRCVNPAHLSAGTQAENRTDCGAKGRNATGDRAGARNRDDNILTPDIARWIRSEAQGGKSRAAIAAQLGVRRRIVANVVTGRAWRVA